MTFKEAKKILEKEGYFLVKVSKGFEFSELPVWEKQEVVEAKRVVNENGFAAAMNTNEWLDRQERLKKEYEKNTKAPGPGEEQPKEDNPALAESASQFNDALLDEQAKEIERLKKENAELLGIVGRMKQDVKEVDYNCNAACKENERLNEKIRELTKEKSNLEDQITVLNACKKHNDKIDRKQIKSLGKEIARLNGIIHDKNAILSDVAEELRLTKIREKNLAELGLKYVGENEKLKKELEKMTKLVETVRKGSKEYCDYGIAAGKMIQKMAKVIVNEGPVSSEDFKEYRRLANGGIFMPEISEEELMKLQEKACVDIAEEGKDHSGVIILCGKDFVKKYKENKEFVHDFFNRHKETAEELYEVADDALDQFLLFGEIIIKSEE